MVEHSATLDSIFAALADPTRRRILEMLAPRERRVSDIAAHFSVSLAAVSKHLQVLERAGLLTRRRQGRTHHLRAKTEAIASAHEWIAQYARGWSEGFDALERHLDSHHAEHRTDAANPNRKARKDKLHDR